MKKALRIVAYVGVCLLLSGCPKNQTRSRGAAAPTTYGAETAYGHDVRGLEQQFEPFLEAYARGNTDSQDKAFAIFAIPEAGNWFGTYFASADVEQLGWDSESEVDAYKKSLLTVMKMLGTAKRFHAQCRLTSGETRTGLRPRADAVKPTREVPVEQFEIAFVSEDGRRFSQLINFVYVNGAYRYVGKGAYPFWSMPDATRK